MFYHGTSWEASTQLKEKVVKWVLKKYILYTAFKETHLKPKDTNRLKVKE